jgi:hypothetical protein
MKDFEILQPLFDIVNRIHCETSIELDFSIRTYAPDHKLICWYVGSCAAPEAGNYMDRLDVNDLDEDKLIEWINALTELYLDATDCKTPDLFDEDTRMADWAEDERRENRLIEEQERNHDARGRT